MAATEHHLACPDAGQLRAHLDDADPGVAAHVATCAACGERFEALRADARWAADRIGHLDPGGAAVDVDAAWRARPRPVAVPPSRWAPSTGRVSALAAAFVALLVAVLVVVTPTGRQAAADFLSMFRSERLAVISFDPDDPTGGLEGLDDIADVEIAGSGHEAVDDLAAAARIAGFTPVEPTTLPAGAQREQIVASAPSTVRVAFDADRAPDLPADLAGSSLVVQVPGSVIAHYAVGDDLLAVAEAGDVVVEAEGADLADIRAYLLDRPEVPANVSRQLLAIDDWTATLPVPVPVDDVVWDEATVAGHAALLLDDPAGSGLLWHDGDGIHAVAGTGVDADELQRVADGLGG